ncbi:MAG: ATP-binding cassette domain-containing protein [Abditibacteriota bacterium]|nr:ATP-binding cassette domain-containing protein [Abditibacteriota bacterium]
MPIINIKDLEIGYNKKTIAKNITFQVEENSCTCIFGENGCGKTTLLKTLSTLIPPISGEAYLNGYSLDKVWQIRKISAFVFQNKDENKDFPLLTKDIVLMGRYRINPYKTTEKDRETVQKVMEKTNTWELRNEPYGRLSGGQRQRVNIALSLASEPKILFLDEPGTYLDTKSRDILIETINNLKENMTILAVSHYKHFTDSVGDQIYEMKL